MADDIQELYREMVMEHNRKPKNFRRLEAATRSAEGFNPFCGDQLTLDAALDGETIADIGFVGSGCAISKASASLMTEAVKGKTTAEAQALFDAFRHMITRGIGAEYDAELLGDLEVLAGVTEFPVRIKCATLPWHTLSNALNDTGAMASTE